MPAPDYDNYRNKVEAAASRVDTDATHAQREAQNARVGHLYVHGLEIAIEYPKGSYRSGVGSDGTTWRRKMECHYGRIKRTEGLDGDPVDVFLGEHPESQLVFVFNQLDDDGNLDEHKVLMMVRNLKEAKDLYLAHYPDNWARERLGEIRGMLMSDFKKWLNTKFPKKSKSNKSAAVFDTSFSIYENAISIVGL